MTMVSSGQIQLGGSNGNRSVNVELGIALSNISMNGSNLRTLAGAPSGQISLSNFYGKNHYTDVTVTMGTYQPGTYLNEFITLYDYHYGYGSTPAAFGSRSPSSVFGYTISDIYTRDNQNNITSQLVVRLATAGLSQSFFTSVYNALLGTKTTASASSFSNSGSSVWTWNLTYAVSTWLGASGNHTVRFNK